LYRFSKNSRTHGSITIEACITLPTFLSVFFILLFLVKFTCIAMVLDYAVNETAKEIAASAYPISFINSLEDERIGEFKEAFERFKQEPESGSLTDIVNILVSEDFNEIGEENTLKKLLADFSKALAGGLLDDITPVYWNMKSAGKDALAGIVASEHLKNPLIKQENVRLVLVEFPQSKAEYESNCRNGKYEDLGMRPGKDFGIDDVVIQLEYDYRVRLPFIDALYVKMVHTAVERAWLNGNYGILTAEDEGLELEPQGTIVFITRTGIRYHRGSCWHLRRSQIPVDIGEAKDRGYTPCKVCKPLEQ